MPTTSPLIAAGARLEKVATGAVWSEGPLWWPGENVLRWSDIPGNRILEWDPQTGQTRVHRTEVEFTNGRALWRGAVVHCSHGRRALEVERNGKLEVLVDRFGEARLNSPNDVAVHPDGSLWFTDPPYGIFQPQEGYPGDQEYGGSYVFRFAAGELTPMITDVLRPNGLGFSPDGRSLYVTDSSAALAEGPDRCIRAYPLHGNGAKTTVGPPQWSVELSPGVPDGIAVDAAGRIWASGGAGVEVVGPDGDRILTLDVPEVVANVCFGGAGGTDLYIAASTSIYRIRTAVRGLP